MPEVVETASDGLTDNFGRSAAAAGGLIGGSMFLGPTIGMPLGGVAAGTYLGGQTGAIVAGSGILLGLASLLFGPVLGGRSAGATSRGSSQPQGVK